MSNPVKDVNDLVTKWEKEGIRLEWDQYFAIISSVAKARSACDRLHVGCVLSKDNRIIATGYNGFLPSAPHESIVKDNHEQATVHAEVNAIADCAKRGVNVTGATAYITHCPCINCLKILIASGIAEIKYLEEYKPNSICMKLILGSGIKYQHLKYLEIKQEIKELKN